MKFTLTVRCDNSAFEDDLHRELARIIREVAHKVDRMNVAAQHRNVHDINGNVVGTYVLKGEED